MNPKDKLLEQVLFLTEYSKLELRTITQALERVPLPDPEEQQIKSIYVRTGSIALVLAEETVVVGIDRTGTEWTDPIWFVLDEMRKITLDDLGVKLAKKEIVEQFKQNGKSATYLKHDHTKKQKRFKR